MSDTGPVDRVEPTRGQDARSAAQEAQRTAKQRLSNILQNVRVEALENALENRAEEGVDFNPLAMSKKFKKLDERARSPKTQQSSSEKKEQEKATMQPNTTAKTAEKFQEKNEELQKRGLLNLLSMLDEGDSPEEILAKVLKSYPDEFLADEAFGFLKESTGSTTKLGKNIVLAQKLLQARYEREIAAGRNVNNDAKAFSKQNIGSSTNLRDLYRDVTGNPRTPVTLFEEFAQKYSFSQLKTVLSFMLHALGSDLRSKGPSISPAELHRLLSETKTMQAILGVYYFFSNRMGMIESLFQKEGLYMPRQIQFETLANLFVKLLMERYPSSDRILRLANSLGISKELLAQIIIFNQYRAAIRGVSPRLFRSIRHRQDLLMTLIETLEELEDALEEEEEEEEDE